MKKPSVFGKYLLLERVNVGGMAEVFIAKAFGVEGFERILAIKKILPTMAEDQEFITMFIDEARISVQLSHANIVHIHELGKYDETFFIAMEYVAGRDLRTILERYRRRGELMPTPQAVFVASKMCEGLDYAHRKKDARGQDLGIIHRDVSPQNILVSYEGEVKIIDFGIAKAANRMQKTQAGILKGKFGYMSPEQVRGMPIDRRSDIFAVGVILYEMLTGEKLFVGESDFSTLEKVRNAEVPLPSQLNPDIPPGLEKVLLRALAREPEDRYQWASDLQEDLMRFLVTGDAMYSGKHLSGFMKESFAEDLQREAEKMERFAAIERPDQLEISNIGSAPRPKRGTGSMPAASRAAAAAPAESERDPIEDDTASDRPAQPQLLASRDYDSEDMDVTEDKTQLVAPGPDVQAEINKIRSEGFIAGDGNIDDSATSLSANSTQRDPDSTPGVMDSITDLNAPAPDKNPLPTSPARPRIAAKQQVVIGEAQEYSGETVIGPNPSRPEPPRAQARQDSLEEDTTGPLRPASPPVLEPSAGSVKPAPSTRPGRVSSPRNEAVRRESPRTQPLRKPTPRSSEQPIRIPRTRAGLLVVGGLAAVVLMILAVVLLVGRKTPGVVVSVSPAEATVTVGTRKVINNTVYPVPPGTYELVATAPGYKTFTKRVTVGPNDTPKVESVDLEPERGDPPVKNDPPSGDTKPPDGTGSTVPVQTTKVDTPPTNPPLRPDPPPPTPTKVDPPRPKTFVARFVAPEKGIEVLVDGRPIGRTPTAQTSLAVGRVYRYSARLAGYKPTAGEVRFEGDPEVEVDLKLEKEPPKEHTPVKPVVHQTPPPNRPPSRAKGRLACSSNPAGAEVYVDNRPTGRQTPIPIGNPLELSVGNHKVVFKVGGRSSAPQAVEIKENEVSTLRNVPIQ